MGKYFYPRPHASECCGTHHIWYGEKKENFLRVETCMNMLTNQIDKVF